MTYLLPKPRSAPGVQFALKYDGTNLAEVNSTFTQASYSQNPDGSITNFNYPYNTVQSGSWVYNGGMDSMTDSSKNDLYQEFDMSQSYTLE